MPDEIDRPVPRPSGGKRSTIDRLDDLALFAEKLPAWVGRDGKPLSWQHFIVGLDYIRRSEARQTLAHFNATLMAAAEKRDREEWVQTYRMIAWGGTDG